MPAPIRQAKSSGLPQENKLGGVELVFHSPRSLRHNMRMGVNASMVSRNLENRAVKCLVIILEDFAGHVDPKDLVSLSRACVPLWNCLEQSSLPWKVALEQNARLVPTCAVVRKPRTLVQLYFTKECTICGDETTNPILEGLAVRLCGHCKMTEVVRVRNQPQEFAYDFWENGTEPQLRENVVFRRDPPGSEPMTVRTPLVAPTSSVTFFPQTAGYNWLDWDIQQLKLQAQKRVNEQELEPERPAKKRNTRRDCDDVIRDENTPWSGITNHKTPGPKPTNSRKTASVKGGAGRKRTPRNS